MALEKQDWDPSVKSLAPFPRILRMMDDELGWTEQLGEAFLADQAAVMDSVQRLRQQAQSAGRLVSFPEATVTAEEQIISIEPSTPDLVYVPVCDPSVVYGDWPYPAFPPDNFHVYSDGATVVGLGCRWLSAPIVAPLWGWQHFHWRKHDINIERSRFAVLNGNHPPIAGDTWGHDPSHRHNVEYRDPGLRARFVGATPPPEAPSMMRGFPPFLVPRVSSARPLRPTLSSDPATDRFRGIPPAFEPFGRGTDVRRFPTAPVPGVHIMPPLGPTQTGEPTTQRIEPTATTHIPLAPEPLGRRANVPIQTELGISRRTFAPAMDPRAGAREFLPSGAESPVTTTTTRKQ